MKFKVLFFLALTLPLYLLSQNNQGQNNENDEKEYFVACIAFYNLENLFDTIDNEDVNDTEFTPEGPNKWNSSKYFEKLANMSKVISEIGTDISPDGPAILGVAEVENILVLRDLANTPLLRGRDYGIVHYDSPDRRGVDVALFYQKKYFTPTHSTVYPLVIAGDTSFRSRDQLVVSGIFDGEPMHFIVAHWPSRRGGEKRSRPLRIEAAKITRHVIDSLRSLDPMAKIVFMGDLNDDPSNHSVKRYLNANGKRNLLQENQLFNTMDELFRSGIGSLAWRDSWNLFDQIIITQAFLNPTPFTYQFHRAKVFNKNYLTSQDGQFRGYPFRTYSFGQYVGGYSDHFPTYIIIKKEKTVAP
ncbi:MAG: endonuclease/exonuclease/phosphatase family protein [Bacteroidales bacterium]|nr:endonuclease/exonuclease/phosphatase family protein [Bacteroidales bacterium]